MKLRLLSLASSKLYWIWNGFGLIVWYLILRWWLSISFVIYYIYLRRSRFWIRTVLLLLLKRRKPHLDLFTFSILSWLNWVIVIFKISINYYFSLVICWFSFIIAAILIYYARPNCIRPSAKTQSIDAAWIPFLLSPTVSSVRILLLLSYEGRCRRLRCLGSWWLATPQSLWVRRLILRRDLLGPLVLWLDRRLPACIWIRCGYSIHHLGAQWGQRA